MAHRPFPIHYVFLFFLTACATVQNVKVNQKLTRTLSSFHTLAVTVEAKDPSLRRYVRNFAITFVNHALGRQIFDQVLLDETGKKETDLRLSLTLMDLAEGTKATRTNPKGRDAEVFVHCILLDGRTRTELTSFEAKGNSRQISSARVGEADVSFRSALDDLTKRAFTSVSDEIVDYLKANQ
jgi:hypothetical protein